MPLEEVVTSLEGISDEYRDLYVEQSDGSFKVDISGLKSAVQQERKLRKAAEKKGKTEDTSPDLDEVKKQLDAANTIIKDMKIGSQMKAAALSAGVHPEYLDDVISLTKGNFGLDESGSVVHMGSDGEPSGISADKFFTNNFKKNKPIFFTNSGRQGSGAQNSDSSYPLSDTAKLEKAIKSGDTKSIIALKQKLSKK